MDLSEEKDLPSGSKMPKRMDAHYWNRTNDLSISVFEDTLLGVS